MWGKPQSSALDLGPTLGLFAYPAGQLTLAERAVRCDLPQLRIENYDMRFRTVWVASYSQNSTNIEMQIHLISLVLVRSH